MKHVFASWIVALAVVGATAAPCVWAEEGSKILPTLLIKGEIVSLDSNDPTATLLKVKDRYGFETPIYLSQETKIARGEQAVAAADLAPGLAVEVEYDFDINTAKRHAVNVKIAGGETPASTTAAASAPTTGQPVSGPLAPVAQPAEVPVAPVADMAAPAASAPASEGAPAETDPAAEPAPTPTMGQPVSGPVAPEAPSSAPESVGAPTSQ